MTLRLRSGQALGLLALLLLSGSPAYAQFRGVDVRPFALLADERFSAQTTFDATLGVTAEPFWGGGVDVVVHRTYFVDFAVSRMSASGQRAFINNGEVFKLKVPLRVAVTPVEITGGYRFRAWKSRVIPYAGVGIGSYGYSETGDFATAGEDTSARHAGFVMVGGAEFRIRKWIGVTGDAQYTKVPGILGQGGISKDAGDTDLGGIAARVRVMLGR